MEQEMEAPEMEEKPEEMGRGTDTVMAHLSLGEVVIPRSFLDDLDVLGMLQSVFAQNGVDMAEFTVGDEANKINPETGYPEFFFKKIFKAIKSIAIPAALSYFAPGIGSSIGGSILGAGAAGASTLGNALVGAGLGGLTGGGLKGALAGAAGGALGANIGNLGGGQLQGPTLSGATLGERAGSGILGAIGDATGLKAGDIPSIGGLVSGGSGGGSSYMPLMANALSTSMQDSALKKQKQAMLGATDRQLANLESFDPSEITKDPGYQFNLEEGQRGLNQQLAAGGNYYSGRALKAATEYNQNYANNAFKDYYQRWLNKVGGQNAIYGTQGDITGNAAGARAQSMAQALSNVIGAPVGAYGQSNLDLDTLRRLGLVA